MEKTRFSADQQALMESMPAPFAIFQLLDKRIVTLVLSDGFCRLLGVEDREEAYAAMDRDTYRNVHPDDAARVAEAGASAGKPWQDILASAEKTLRTNGISMIDSEIKVSPTMTFDGDKCQVVGEMAEMGNSFLKREYRAPFVVPEIV